MKKYRIKLSAEWIVRGFDERDALKKFILYRRELDQEGSYTFDNMIRDNTEFITEKDKKRKIPFPKSRFRSGN